uniref:KIB1-4 beta-propeller domain-containing protein n=1 Tax=Triticum urartu TaxID=4572 RepID=A0A8R7U0X8_TRIUA
MSSPPHTAASSSSRTGSPLTPRACVLNPFTGYLVRFMAPMVIDLVAPAAAVTHFEGEPTLVLFCDEYRTMYAAELDSGCFIEFRDWYPYKRVGFLGFFYAGGDVSDKIYDLMSSFGVRPSEMLAVYPFEDFDDPAETRHTDRCFLVESAGELLMIFKLQQHMELFKIDNDRSAPEPVKSIGNRAIFLGYRQCLSINVDKFHSVEANCIYYLKCIDSRLSIYKYDLKDEKEEWISGAISCSINDLFLCDVDRPFTIIQLLSSYTISVWGSELEYEKSFEQLHHVIPNAEEFRLSSYLEDLEFNDD